VALILVATGHPAYRTTGASTVEETFRSVYDWGGLHHTAAPDARGSGIDGVSTWANSTGGAAVLDANLPYGIRMESSLYDDAAFCQLWDKVAAAAAAYH
jgi:hypothetical protein